MRPAPSLVLAAVLAAGIAWGQKAEVRVGPATATTVAKGTSVPGACLPGQFFYKTDSQALYMCLGVAFASIASGSGSVSSIGLLGTANQILVTGASPITSSGSWTLSFPPGGVTLPGTTSGTFSGNLTGNVTGTASGLSATLAVNQGGTGTAGTLTGIMRGSASAMTAAELSGDASTSGSNAVTNTKINGTSVPVNSAADQVLQTTGSATGAWKSLPACLDSAGNHLNYDTVAHVWSCGTSAPAAAVASVFTRTGAVVAAAGDYTFGQLASGTNTTATDTVGTGGSLTFSGSGVVNANQLNGTAFTGTSGNLVKFGAANIPADSGVVAANAVVAVSPGAGLAHFAGSTQTVTSSSVVNADIASSTIDLTTKVTGVLPSANSQPHAIEFSVDGGSSVLTTGDIGLYPTADFACTISRIDISGTPSGSVTVDVWKAAGAIPTSGNKISASAPLTLSSSQLSQAGSISGWTTAVSVGDVFGFSIATATTVTRIKGVVWCN